jgi:hypothetical protein
MNDRSSGDATTFLLASGRSVEIKWPDREPDWREKIVWGPVQIVLPDNEMIELDWIPYKGWGTEPGKRYTTSTCDEDGNVTLVRSWVVPPACDGISLVASEDNPRSHAGEE